MIPGEHISLGDRGRSSSNPTPAQGVRQPDPCTALAYSTPAARTEGNGQAACTGMALNPTQA